MSAWLTVVGMGEDGIEGLGAAARRAIDHADVIVGSPRLLSLLPQSKSARGTWPVPFDAKSALEPHRGRKVVALASGDPMHYGAGHAVLTAFTKDEVVVLPHLSAFTLAASRLGWALQDVETISLHGRPVSLIEPLIAPGARILAFTEGDATIRAVAERLAHRGYGKSSLVVLEHMGGSQQRQMAFSAIDVPEKPFADLATLAIECVADADAPLLSRSPGLPDEAFEHDGLITKQDVRAVTLAALNPTPGALLWDVGAGCGSIGIEWMRAARGAHAIAFERAVARRGHIAKNAEALGTPGIEVVPGELPHTLADRPPPDAVFIGGALGVPGVFERSWEALKPGGRIVANVVTIEGEAHLMDLHEKHGGDLVRIDLSYLSPVGGFRSMRPRLPVTQWRARKP